MSGFDYVKIESWHVIDLTTRGGGKTTLCGRYVASPTVTELSQRLPLGEKSCESCARLALSSSDSDSAPEVTSDDAPSDEEGDTEGEPT